MPFWPIAARRSRGEPCSLLAASGTRPRRHLGFTAERWDADQADAYIREIVHRCDDIAAGRAFGLDAGHIRVGYERVLIQSHVAYFHRAADGINVIRILHQRMDANSQV